MNLRPDTPTAWASGGDVLIRAHPAPVPISLEDARSYHSWLLREMLDEARRARHGSVDLLKRLETDLREAIRGAGEWRRAARIAA